MTLTLTLRTGFGMRGNGSDGELGNLAQTIKNLAEYHDKPPQTEVFEPYSERMTTVAEYIRPFKNEKTGAAGHKVNQEVLPLDVLGIYLVERRTRQIHVVFESPIDLKMTGEALGDNPETDCLKLHGRCIRNGTRIVAIMDGRKLIITTGRTNPAFVKVLAAVETIYHSGAFIESAGAETEAVGDINATSEKPEIRLEQKMDLRLETRLAVIQTVEGTIRPEMKMEQRQILAMRMAPLMRASTDEIRAEIPAQTKDEKAAYRKVLGVLAGRIMRDSPPDRKPRNFGDAIRIAHRIVQTNLRKQPSG